MKKTVTLLIIVTLTAFTVNAQNWVHSMEQAISISKMNHKLILVDFYADWCHPCKMMDTDTWNKTEVKEQMKKMIAVKINIDYNSALASQFNVKAIPTITIIDSWDNVYLQETGYIHKSTMVRLLSGFPDQIKDLSEPLTQLEENRKNPVLLMNVAIAVQEIAKQLNDKGRDAFVRNSTYYFNSARKIFKKEKDLESTEKIDLLIYYNKIINGRANQAIKQLEKTGIENISEMNRALACFILVNGYMKKDDNETARDYIDKLKLLKGNSSYVEELNEKYPEIIKQD